MTCTQCPRKCSVQRDNKKGFCGVNNGFVVARAAKHFWEEPCISGTKGSGTVFFSGCSLRCVFCQNHEISTGCYGKEIDKGRLIEIFDELTDSGVHNINLVNPTHYAHQLADVLATYKKRVPFVYNSSGYERVETLTLLDGLIDIYLPDMKYVDGAVSLKYSAAADYFEYASKALIEMRRQVTDRYNENSIMQSGMIVRHLILPKNTRNSMNVLDWLKANLPNTRISLMAQYTPHGKIDDFAELQRRITTREYNKVLDYMESIGITKAYVQELESSNKDFIPPFDLSGV